MTEKFSGVITLPDERERLTQSLKNKYIEVLSQRGIIYKDDENTRNKLKHVTDWFYDTPKRGLLLCGTVGSGKTTMLKALSKLISRSSIFEAIEVYDYHKKNCGTFPPYYTNGVLLIDDLGEEPRYYIDYEDKRHPLADMLKRQYSLNAITIISTNLTPDEILSRYGDKVYDRMKEMYHIIKYQAPSYRH